MYIPDKISIKPFHGLRLKTFSVLLLISSIETQQLLAQVADDFSDGDFTTNPSWNGSTSDFMVNNSSQLQLNNTVAGTSYLYSSFQSSAIDDYEWEFYVKQSFAPSGGNFGRFYLVSDQSDLSSPLNGYYLQFGEALSNDAVELFRQSGSTSISVCRATTAGIAASFEIRVKVTRNNSGLWQLYIDHTGGTDYVPEASGTDLTHTTSAYFGILCTYTITNSTRFYYDEIVIRSIIGPDTSPPEIVSLEVVSSNELRIVFSEDLDANTAQTLLNYDASPSLGNPTSAVWQMDQQTVQLLFSQPFTNGLEATLTVKDLQDLAGNYMILTERKFLYFKPEPVNFRDIIITEIFPDPTPQVGLPASEFVELYNRSVNPIKLDGWHFTDGFSIGMLSSYILLPGNYLILSSSTTLDQFTEYGQTLSVSIFPTLNNASDRLVLKDPNEEVIDSVHYSGSWYKDENKEAGGWTLERIDPENACENESNWIASTDPSGGTPGKQNSVHQIIPDITGPKLLEAIQLTGTILQLVFDEKLGTSLPGAADFSIEPSPGIVAVSFADGSLTKINLELSQNADTAITYGITAQNIYDCPGNVIEPGYNKAYLNLDLIPPFVASVQATSATTVSVAFSERVSQVTSELISNYFIPALGNPASVTLQDDQKSLILFYTLPFQNGNTFTITIKDVTDIAGNAMAKAEKNFLYFEAAPAHFKDVIITEFCADPSPQVGLPEAEFVELYNRSENPFDLSGWTLTDETSSGELTSFILLPGQYLILTSSNASSGFTSFGQGLSVSPFPSLNNSGDVIIVKDADGLTIDSLRYAVSWYQDEEKADGGWSMELIDPENTCAEASNWAAGEAEMGGTPGKLNSVYANKPDNTGPKLLSVMPTNPTTLLLTFDEKLGKVRPLVEQFTIDPPLNVDVVSFGDPSLTTLTLSLLQEVEASKKYILTVKEIYDCPGNKIQDGFLQATFILPEQATSGDIIVNEILFNPRSTGVDFVEIYNRSNKTINLQNWSVGNFNIAVIENAKVISDKGLLIHPNEYRVFTENANVLKGEYLMGIEEVFVEMNLPAFNDDEGSVAIVDEQGAIIDAFQYTDKMHGVFIKDDEGVSLERISFDWQLNETQNWRSASATVGFATPGYLNSNVRRDVLLDDESVIVEPEIFQPHVSTRDFTQIKYRFDRGGFVANVKIFDQEGRAIKELAHNELLGTEGFFRWDGDQDNGSRARMGYYLVWFEIFDAGGILKTYKKRVAIY